MSDAFWTPDGLDAYVEAVGSCNLSCPACGNGHLPHSRPGGILDPGRLERILDKLEAEAPSGARPRVHLFNWGEPLLHPELPELVRRVRRRGLSCRLSSNLVRPRDLDAVVAAAPDWFRVSVSGFTQPVYGRTHRGGDVERVKANLLALRGAIDRHRVATAV
ncbi:MAG TPA: radical SAM protein, partial [Anaeromyxobacteraceae bacterium]|nr:radical SAM protein [Anaeromyxobacteraceae bacterium]